MASLFNQVPSVSTVFALYTSLSAISMILRRIINEIVPKPIRDYINVKVVDLFTSYCQQTFRAAEVYFKMRLAGLSTGQLLVGSSDLKNPEAEPNLGIPVNTKIVDEFEGIHLEWTLHCVELKSYPFEKRYFNLTCKKEFREKIMTDYLTYIATSAEKIMRHREKLFIYSYSREGGWQSAK
ncbi:predicted protein [Arabidopsis lyrata subsp. lyrata]|uniref:Predicted protein n=2 Tax=Arabidopsis lyrata subsp. lyrata TaxID=81972 RepID=D7MST4_ARALL|nr:predicted protein [Arabidopsis lyrata subsp. lyrata]